MKRFRVSIMLALRSIRANLSKTSLTMFGVVIGIMMVVVVFSAGAGIRSIIFDEISSFGNNWVSIEVKVPSTKKNSQENAGALGRGVVITSLTLADIEEIQRLSRVSSIYAGITTQITVEHRGNTKTPTVFGVTAAYHEINRSKVVDGRFFDAEDDRSLAQVIVLGHGVHESLFGDQSGVGQTISAGGSRYQVIGVMEPIGTTGFIDMDAMVYIPFQTVQKKIMGISHVMFAVGELVEGANAADVSEEIRFLLRDRHDISDPEKEDFAVTTFEEAADIVGTIVTAVTWLLIGLACISLVVGGVGIMNVMYVSVAERKFEIGLRKALGATDRDILWQFLVESVCITGAGGIIGMLCGAALSYAIAHIAQGLGLAWVWEVSLFSLVLSTAFSMVVGIVFGVYPAKTAARLHPISALQQE